MPRLSLVVPAYNEEESVGPFATEAGKILPTLGLGDYEIIVVDDGSTDSTWGLLQSIRGSVPKVVLARHDRNLGYGAALMTGIGMARMEYIAYTDVDLQFDLGDLGQCIRLLPDHDLVVGYREPRMDPFHRVLVARAYNRICNRVFGLGDIRDIDCSMKAFHRSALDGTSMDGGGFGFDLGLVLACRRKGCRIAQIPVRHRRRQGGRSKVSSRQVFRTILEMLRIAREAPDDR